MSRPRRSRLRGRSSHTMVVEDPVPSRLIRCQSERCRAPIACGGFGYCRDRNRDGLPSKAEAERWQKEDAPR